jgi:hypothetical protein
VEAEVEMVVAAQADIIKIHFVKSYFAVLLFNREDFFYVCQLSNPVNTI